MILISHALVGTALTNRHVHGAAIFFTAFASHYLLDAIPHWHYSVPRVKKAVNDLTGKKTLSWKAAFLPDFLKIAVDCSIGALLSYLLFDGGAMGILLAVSGAVFPDFLIGLARFYPNRFLELHYTFHRWIHSRVRLDEKPLFGITTQVAFVALMVFLGKKFF